MSPRKGGGDGRADAPKAPAPHPRNRHTGRYDFPALVRACPALAEFVAPNAYGDDSVDFANPAAVRALNRALLAAQYGVAHWDIPEGRLCPPIPGRADYLHHLADLLASDLGGNIPRGAGVRVLDIGVGANCVYPLIGHAEYGWSFTGSDADDDSLACAERILTANRIPDSAVELRLQENPGRILAGVAREGDRFALTMCNPPFHASAEAAGEGTRRKWRNLGRGERAAEAPSLNFGGSAGELWCPGGETAFVRRMVEESVQAPRLAVWFTSLISKSENLPAVREALARARATEVRTLNMAQGAKQSRFVAWTFLPPAERTRRLREG